MSSNLAYTPSFRLLNSNSFSQVWENEINGEKALIATAEFLPGDSITSFSAGSVHQQPTYLTVQVDENSHITLLPEFLQYINHSCSPNVFFDTANFQLLCLREIKAGDEMSFFYPSSEWDMEQAFACRCQAGNCLKYINGASHISPDILEQYRLTDFITRKAGRIQ